MPQMSLNIRTAFEGTTRAGRAFSLYAFLAAFDFVALVSGVSIGRIAAVFLLLVLSLDFASIELQKRSYVGLALGFFFSCLIVLLLMLNPVTGLSGLFGYALNVCIFVLMCGSSLTDQDYRLCERAFILSTLVLCILMQTNAGAVGTEWVTDRTVVNIAGSQQDPNQFCGYFLFAIAYCTYFSVRKGRLILLAVVAACFYTVMLTGSRGGLAAAGTACLVSLCFGLRESKHKIMYVIFALSLFLLVLINFDNILSYLPPSVASRFERVSLSAGSASTRIRAWEDVLQAYASSDVLHQLLGHGYNSTTEVTFNGLVAHNTYIEMLYSFGVVGFLFYLMLQLVCCAHAWRSGKYPLLSAMLAFDVLLSSITDSSSRTMWILMILAVVDAGRSAQPSMNRGEGACKGYECP